MRENKYILCEKIKEKRKRRSICVVLSLVYLIVFVYGKPITRPVV